MCSNNRHRHMLVARDKYSLATPLACFLACWVVNLTKIKSGEL